MDAVAVVDPGNPFLAENTIEHLSEFTFSEEATPITIGDSAGATPDLTVTGVRGKHWAMATGKPLQLTTDFGTARGTISNIEAGAQGGTAKYTADSLLNRLNVELQAPPYFQLNGNLAADNFTGENSTTSLGVAPSGQTWQALAGTWGRLNDQAYLVIPASRSAATVLTTSRDQNVSAKVTVGGNSATNYYGVLARATDASNYYFADYDNTGAWRLGKYVGGVLTVLRSGTGFVSGDTIQLRALGNLIAIARNSTVLNSVVDTSLATGSWAGIVAHGFAPSTLSRWDDFTVTESSTSTGNLYNAFTAYTRLVGIPDDMVEVDPEIQYMPVIFPGFVGNLWDKIKQMCSALGLQCYSTGSKIGLTKPGKISIELIEPAGTAFAISRGDVVREVKVTNHRHTTTTSGVFAKADSVYSVEAGEVQEVSITTAGTPALVNNPVCVAGMNLNATGGTGQYVVTGQDGYIISPALWRDLGGSIVARVSTEDASEIIVTITAPEDESRAPYRISEGEDRPALWITGAGVLSNPEEIVVATGNSNAAQETIDAPENVYIRDIATAYKCAFRLAQAYAGPSVTLTLSGVPELILTSRSFSYTVPPYDTQYQVPEKELTEMSGFLAGALYKYDDSVYRIITASYTNKTTTLTLTRHVTFKDFDQVWAGKTFAQFNAAQGPDIEFGQFDIFPLGSEA